MKERNTLQRSERILAGLQRFMKVTSIVDNVKPQQDFIASDISAQFLRMFRHLPASLNRKKTMIQYPNRISCDWSKMEKKHPIRTRVQMMTSIEEQLEVMQKSLYNELSIIAHLTKFHDLPEMEWFIRRTLTDICE